MAIQQSACAPRASPPLQEDRLCDAHAQRGGWPVGHATLDGRRHHFGVSGLLYNSDVLLYDRESESLWSQIMSQAISGPMKARKLKPIPLLNTAWRDWRKRHPATLVLARDTGHARDYERDPYAAYDQSPELMFPVAFRSLGYHPKEYVLGIELDGVARAYPVSELARGPEEFRDTIGTRPVIVRYDDANVSGEILDAAGAPLPFVQAYWFAWYAFHPDTTPHRGETERRSALSTEARLQGSLLLLRR